MRFLLVNTDYPAFLDRLYREHPGLAERLYDEQMRVRSESLFGTADFYSANLRALGHEAWDIHANNEPLQRAWAREHGVRCERHPRWRLRLRGGLVPWVSRVDGREWVEDILAAQIRHYRPDVVLNHDPGGIGCAFWRSLKPYFRLLVGQHAATQLRDGEDWGAYDLVLSSFPPTLEWIRARGGRAELFRLGFEPSILDRLARREKTIPVSFVGSLQPIHSTRLAWLEVLARTLPIKIWTPDEASLAHSPLRRCCAGVEWGTEMYQVIRDSQITLNHHGNVPPFANNMRLYEATGVGTLLITDWKENLPDMFEPGKEVVVYRTAEECAERIAYYLDHPEEREVIARAGQERTLRDHNYRRRMEEFIEIVRRCLPVAQPA